MMSLLLCPSSEHQLLFIVSIHSGMYRDVKHKKFIAFFVLIAISKVSIIERTLINLILVII